MYIDTHAHLNDDAFNDDLDAVIERCMDNNVTCFIVVGFNKETNKKAIQLAHKYPFIYATVGIHPSDYQEYTEENKALIIEQLKDPKVVAIGECGLDYYWEKENKEEQKASFLWQISLSLEYNKPLIIHMRDASKDMIDILRSVGKPLRGVMHGYSASVEMIKDFNNVGLIIALGGTVTFKNAIVPKEVAKAVNLDKLVLETDCPYLTPHPYRGKRNTPEYIPLIAREIAQQRGISVQEIMDRTTNNAINLFGLEELK